VTSPKRAEREYDVVLWGATGFTGKLVAEYLVERYGAANLKLALAGRNRMKLEAVRKELERVDPDAARLPLLLGDSFDEDALTEMASKTRVVCTTVGPYAKYGHALVAACVKTSTDYVDLTGEAQFIKEMIDLHQSAAEESGARIVHCCGYDSIPSDLATLMMYDAFSERGGRLHQVRHFAGESKGGASGGTIASMLNIVDEAKKNPQLRRILVDPYALYPEGEPPGLDGRDPQGVRYDQDLGMWCGPFVMAAINSKVVRRSNALMGFPYGRELRYSEEMSTGKGPKGFARATVVAGGVAAFLAAVAGPTRGLLEKRLPSPGEGPSKEARESGYFVSRFIADGRDAEGEALQLRGVVKGVKDPGYGETAKMLGESALCLATDDVDAPGGIRTPASTMGKVLIERLRDAGMTFELT